MRTIDSQASLSVLVVSILLTLYSTAQGNSYRFSANLRVAPFIVLEHAPNIVDRYGGVMAGNSTRLHSIAITFIWAYG